MPFFNSSASTSSAVSFLSPPPPGAGGFAALPVKLLQPVDLGLERVAFRFDRIPFGLDLVAFGLQCVPLGCAISDNLVGSLRQSGNCGQLISRSATVPSIPSIRSNLSIHTPFDSYLPLNVSASAVFSRRPQLAAEIKPLVPPSILTPKARTAVVRHLARVKKVPQPKLDHVLCPS